LPDKGDYINYDFRAGGITLSKTNIDLLPIHSFNSTTLKRIKDNISFHYSASSEKGIQSKFVKNAGQFLDSEFAYSFGGSKIRIDLVWIDMTNEKIIFVELKTIGDQRVYNTKILTQLTDYNNFAKSFKSDIEVYYRKVFDIKKRLGILPGNLKTLTSLKTFSLEVNPLLLFGDCEQQWINNNAKSLDARIRGVAVGCYYFGGTGYNCDLISVSKRNRHIL
jgi:hypothetical protein